MANPLSRVKSFFSKVAKTISESPLGKALRSVGERLGIIKPKPPPPPPKPPTVTQLKTPIKPPTVTPQKTEFKPTVPPKITPPSPPKPPTPPRPPTPPKVTPLVTPVRAVPVRPPKGPYYLIIALCIIYMETQYGKIKLVRLHTEIVRPYENLEDRIKQLRGAQCISIKVYTFDHIPNQDDIERALTDFLYGV